MPAAAPASSSLSLDFAMSASSASAAVAAAPPVPERAKHAPRPEVCEQAAGIERALTYTEPDTVRRTLARGLFAYLDWLRKQPKDDGTDTGNPAATGELSGSTGPGEQATGGEPLGTGTQASGCLFCNGTGKHAPCLFCNGTGEHAVHDLSCMGAGTGDPSGTTAEQLIGKASGEDDGKGDEWLAVGTLY